MNKQEIILETALKLFTVNGFHGTATAKIALDSGVANGTLFNYFKTKEELILGLYYTILKDMDNFILSRLTVHSVSKEAFRSIYEATISWHLEKPYQSRYVLQFNHSPYFKLADLSFLKKDENPLCVLIQNGIDLVLIKPMPVAFIYSLFVSQINGLNDYIISNNIPKLQQTDLIEDSFQMFWKMIED